MWAAVGVGMNHSQGQDSTSLVGYFFWGMLVKTEKERQTDLVSFQDLTRRHVSIRSFYFTLYSMAEPTKVPGGNMLTLYDRLTGHASY